jgi:heme/copper-type cytochrome/quinol oxidase subunit 3
VSTSTLPVSPTTGEPITTIARRGRVGLWFMIVADVAGTIALVISYSYLWSLNVNGGWAPPGSTLTADETDSTIPSDPKASFAVEWPFWVILLVVVVATVLMWFGYRSARRGHHAGLVVGTGLSLVVSVAALVFQWIQMSTFPFGAGDGAYASAVLLLCASNIFHLFLLIFIGMGIFARARKGLIDKTNWYQAQAASYYMTWVCIAFLLGAILTTFMVESPNVDPAIFGTFKQQ